MSRCFRFAPRQCVDHARRQRLRSLAQ